MSITSRYIPSVPMDAPARRAPDKYDELAGQSNGGGGAATSGDHDAYDFFLFSSWAESIII